MGQEHARRQPSTSTNYQNPERGIETLRSHCYRMY